MGRASVQHQEICVRRRLHPVVRSLPPWRNLLRLRRGDTEELDNFLELPYFVGAETSGTIEAAILGAEKVVTGSMLLGLL